MSTTNPETHHHENPFRGFDDSVERTVGADMRLIYGLGAPILLVLGVIVILAVSPATWLVVAIVLIEIAALAIVLTGFMGMLNQPDEDEAEA